MPQPPSERPSLEVERAELANDLVRHHAELDAMGLDAKSQREMRTWQIQRIQKRIAYLEARLASTPTTD